VVKNSLVRIALITECAAVFSQVVAGRFREDGHHRNKPRSACATALEPTTVYFIPRADMLGCVQASPSLRLGLLQEISNRLRSSTASTSRKRAAKRRLVVVGRFARSCA